MIVHFYTRHEWLGASSRYRSIQYFDFLMKNNISIVHRPLFTDGYLKRKYKQNSIFLLYAVFCYLKRLLNIFFDFRPGNVLVLEKEFFPYFPAFFERIARKIGVCVIVDFDDAVWHNYDNHHSKYIRCFLSNKHKTVINSASGVICGNSYLYEYAASCKQDNIIILPTVVPKAKYHISKNKSNLFTVVWIGSPSTSHHVLSIQDQLRDFTNLRCAEIKLIGFNEALKQDVKFNARFVDWDNDTEIKELCDSDVGIMPLIDGPFERGKCGFKIIQYMGVGKACIASDVGVNKDIVVHGNSGFVVKHPDDWLSYLLYLYDNPLECQFLGTNGRRLFEEKYTVESQALRYISFIQKSKEINN